MYVPPYIVNRIGLSDGTLICFEKCIDSEDVTLAQIRMIGEFEST